MRLVIKDDYNGVSEWSAKYIKKRILEFAPTSDRFFTLGLPTGIKKIHEHRLNFLSII